jgi:hypothetical protein
MLMSSLIALATTIGPATEPAYLHLPLDANAVLWAISTRGAAHVVSEIGSNEDTWGALLDAVAEGQDAWLEVGAQLRPFSDGEAGETLAMGFAEALATNPTGVLRRVEPLDACNSLGFADGLVADSPVDQEAWVEARTRAVGAVTDPRLLKKKQDCLVLLNESRFR